MSNKYDLIYGVSLVEEYKQQIVFVEPTRKEKIKQKVNDVKLLLIEMLWAIFGGIGFTLMIASAIKLARLL